MMNVTSISVKEETWEALNKLKKVGNTMDDVIRSLLETYKRNSNFSDESTISEHEYIQLLDDLIVDDAKFNEYLEKSRNSFIKGI